MKLLNQLIEKKLENSEHLLRNLSRRYSFEEHICVYLHCLFYLGLDDPEIKKKKILWKKFIQAQTIDEKEKYYKKLLRFMRFEDGIILEAINKIEESKSDQDSLLGKLYKPFTIGMIAYEWWSEE